MVNILFLHSVDHSRRLPCLLSTPPSRQTSYQCCPADHAECLLKLLELCFVETFCEYVGSLLLCLGRHHYDLTLKDLFSYVVIVNFYVFGPCMKDRIFCQTNGK